MSVTKTTYATSAAVTITLTSLASGSARESTAIDNATNLYLDAMLYVALKLAAGTPAGEFTVYAYGSEDGTNYDENVTGSNAAITLRTSHNLQVLGRINAYTSGALTYKMTFTSVATALGGILPRKWGVVILNSTGLAMDSSGSSISYTGVTATTA